MPLSLEERRENIKSRIRKSRPVSPWTLLIAVTIFQVLTVIQLIIARDNGISMQIPVSFALLIVLMWAYVIFLKSVKRRGFEMEMIAFFLSTLSLAVTASRNQEATFKQFAAVAIGVALFFALCLYLRDLERTKKVRMLLVGISVILLLINLVFGTNQNGATNWVHIAGISVQLSELVKIAFIYTELLMPTIVLGAVSFAYVLRLTRTEVGENLSADHVRTTRAKGLSGARIMLCRSEELV